ncbi:O-antigen ligase family protein [Dokdonella soli]|uniref:O-antigen ligase-related domain-containing protein n=1 Tax=Dokdonella soli TaxID=529810 RepID=A0ABN1IJN8_9GAMM
MSYALYLLYLVLTYLRPIETYAPDLADYRPMLWLWALAFIFAAGRAGARREIAARPLFLGLMLLLTAAIAASLLARMWLGGAIDALVEFSTAAMLFVLTCLNLTSIARVRRTCTVIVLCMLVISALTIAAYHDGFMMDQLVLSQSTDAEDALAPINVPTAPAEDTSGETLWRVRYLGFLNDPNDLAQAIIVVLPLLWVTWRRGRGLRNMVLIGVPTATLLYSLYLTHSRGGLLGLAAIFIFGMRRMLGTTRMALLAIVVAVGVNAADFSGGRRFSTGEESANDRIEAWYSGIQMLKAHPLFGVGYGSFTDFHPERTAHNSFVLCFSELGLLGFFAWTALLVVAFRELGEAVRRTPAGSFEHRITSALRYSLIGFLTCAWFLSRTYQPELYLLLALCASAAWCVRRTSENNETTSWAPQPWLGMTALSMLAAVVTVYGFIVMGRVFGS